MAAEGSSQFFGMCWTVFRQSILDVSGLVKGELNVNAAEEGNTKVIRFVECPQSLFTLYILKMVVLQCV